MAAGHYTQVVWRARRGAGSIGRGWRACFKAAMRCWTEMAGRMAPGMGARGAGGQRAVARPARRFGTPPAAMSAVRTVQRVVAKGMV